MKRTWAGERRIDPSIWSELNLLWGGERGLFEVEVPYRGTTVIIVRSLFLSLCDKATVGARFLRTSSVGYSFFLLFCFGDKSKKFRVISHFRSFRRAVHTGWNLYVYGETAAVLDPGNYDWEVVICYQLSWRPSDGYHLILFKGKSETGKKNLVINSWEEFNYKWTGSYVFGCFCAKNHERHLKEKTMTTFCFFCGLTAPSCLGYYAIKTCPCISVEKIFYDLTYRLQIFFNSSCFHDELKRIWSSLGSDIYAWLLSNRDC